MYTEPVIRDGHTMVGLTAPAMWMGRQWAVTEVGLECLTSVYVIGKDDLLSEFPDWSYARQVAGKPWVDLDDFMTAWFVAIALLRSLEAHDLVAEIGKAQEQREITTNPPEKAVRLLRTEEFKLKVVPQHTALGNE